MKRAIALALLLVVAATFAPAQRRAPVAEACAFASPPTTYETTEERELYIRAIDLAG